MNAVEAEVRCRALVAALWTHHAIIAAEEDGRAIVRIMATVPPLRGMTVLAETRRTSIGRAWRALLPLVERRATLEMEHLERHAVDLDARAKHERESAAKVRAILMGVALDGGDHG